MFSLSNYCVQHETTPDLLCNDNAIVHKAIVDRNPSIHLEAKLTSYIDNKIFELQEGGELFAPEYLRFIFDSFVIVKDIQDMIVKNREAINNLAGNQNALISCIQKSANENITKLYNAGLEDLKTWAWRFSQAAFKDVKLDSLIATLADVSNDNRNTLDEHLNDLFERSVENNGTNVSELKQHVVNVSKEQTASIQSIIEKGFSDLLNAIEKITVAPSVSIEEVETTEIVMMNETSPILRYVIVLDKLMSNRIYIRLTATNNIDEDLDIRSFVYSWIGNEIKNDEMINVLINSCGYSPSLPLTYGLVFNRKSFYRFLESIKKQFKGYNELISYPNLLFIYPELMKEENVDVDDGLGCLDNILDRLFGLNIE